MVMASPGCTTREVLAPAAEVARCTVAVVASSPITKPARRASQSAGSGAGGDGEGADGGGSGAGGGGSAVHAAATRAKPAAIIAPARRIANLRSKPMVAYFTTTGAITEGAGPPNLTLTAAEMMWTWESASPENGPFASGPSPPNVSEASRSVSAALRKL